MNVWGHEKKIKELKRKAKYFESQLRYVNRNERGELEHQIISLRKGIENWKYKLDEYKKHKKNKKGG